MSTNCVVCVRNPRTGHDLLCDRCRELDALLPGMAGNLANRITVFSPDRLYRYTLWREWDNTPMFMRQHESVNFIGLNPSTADEIKNDQTIRKDIGFAQRWGFGALCKTNIFAFRETKPHLMRRVADSVGPHNDKYLVEIAKDAQLVVAAWGCHGEHRDRGKQVAEMLRGAGIALKCFRITKHGHPEHPLYMPYETQLIDYP